MSIVHNLLAVAYLTTAFSFHAAAETVVVAPPSAKSFGSLRVNGEVSKDPQQRIYIDKKGKKSIESRNLTGQDLNFNACKLERNASGIAKRGSVSECLTLDLNKEHKIPAGSYYLEYSSTIMVAEVSAGEKKVINLTKIQAPLVAGKPVIQLYIDYKSEREQNKYLFYIRADVSQDYYSALQAEYWGRNFLKPFMDSGSYADVPSAVREAFFTNKSEFCQVNNEGIASECSLDRVGSFNSNGTRSECKEKTKIGTNFFGVPQIYTANDCKETKVTYNAARAYFLVFPGTYMMKWSDSYWDGEEGTLVKSGIVAN